MQIHSIEIDNMRSIQHLELKDIPETGVCMISGPNEVGKSTIVEAINLVLTEKSTANKQWIRDMCRVGSNDPLKISLTATIGEQHLTITKEYPARRTATLVIHSPRPATYTDSQANDMLGQIIDEHLDKNLRSLLFVKQGELDHTLGEVGFSSLEKPLRLAGEDGAESISRSSQSELMAKVQKHVERFYTKRGKPNRELKQALEAVDSARQQHAQAQEQIADLSSLLDSFEATEAELARLEPQIPELRKQLEASQRTVTQAEKRESVRENLHTKKNFAAAKKSEIEKNAQRRVRAAEDVAASEKLVSELEQTHAVLSERATEHAARLARLREDLETAMQAEKDSQAECRVWEQHHRAVRGQIAHQNNIEFLEQVDLYTEEIAELNDKLPQIVPTEEDLARAERITEKILYAQATVAAASSTLSLSGEAGSEISINGDSHTLGDSATVVTISERTTIRIGGVDAVIEPAANVASEKDTLDQLKQERRQLFDTFDVVSIQQLKDIAATAESITARIEGLKKDRKRHVGPHDVEDIRRAVDTFRPEELPEGITADEAGETALEERLSELRQVAEQAHTASSAVREKYDEARSESIDKDVAVAAEKLKDARDELDRRTKVHEAILEEHSEEAVEAELRTYTAQLAELDAALDALDEDSVISLEAARRAADQDKTWLSNTQQSVTEQRERQSEIRGRINGLEGAAENAKKAEAELERRESILARTQHKADVAKLLLDTLERHYREVTQRYADPIRNELERLARQLHGDDVVYEFGENGLTGRVMHEKQVNVSELSGGASEQLGLMLRLAIANLAAKNASAGEVDTVMPVIMDDALGNSDVLRLKRLSGMIEKEAETKQIFLMTCDPQRFAAIDKRKEYRVQDLKRAAN
ncbi:chromosome segregation protein [Corynebacterium ciconiae DSM 44920]|uniref:AAA family ATPase n=1 Tax=Corynebacterium ciconiae TaxID=227319 RepID=UPI0003628A24|nr:AAA family ATPase [Corynebacterium ciconiae]WKD60958.1 chromosome segregation protein [Corynebacterium ciconiae DSM 44920]